MNKLYLYILGISIVVGCNTKDKNVKEATRNQFNKVTIENILLDSISIRAITVSNEGLFYAGSQGKFGKITWDKGFKDFKTFKDTISYANRRPNFRAVSQNTSHYFLLSIESPGLLYKMHKDSLFPKLVYKEEGEKVFYDALTFIDSKNGLAIGDPTDSCMSVISTKDGGNTWSKVRCSNLPKVGEGEAVFAASNGNIAYSKNKIWFVSGGMVSKVYISDDGGKNWSSKELPILQGSPTTGAYAVDFYNENIGIAYGGDYTKPEENTKNVVRTVDGGQNWRNIANGANNGYKSAVQFIPGGRGKEIVAVGFTGISLSNNGGDTWKSISDESFYTIRFLNDSIAFAAGKNRIAKLTFM